MQIAISNKHPKTIVRHYAFHIQQNLVKKIKRKLNCKWDDFIKEFYTLCNSLVISEIKNTVNTYYILPRNLGLMHLQNIVFGKHIFDPTSRKYESHHKIGSKFRN